MWGTFKSYKYKSILIQRLRPGHWYFTFDCATSFLVLGAKTLREAKNQINELNAERI
jgi:hypothetical protein